MIEWLKSLLAVKYVAVMMTPYGDIIVSRSRFKFLLEYEVDCLSSVSLCPLEVRHIKDFQK